MNKTGESMSTRDPQAVPATASEQRKLAERFASFADYAASTVSLPQTAATSLDVARFHAFTGEITFSVDPAVRLYLDGGSVYHAERDGDRPVSRLLLDAGVIDSVQLQRGTVRVGDVDHLGRLFDRDTTIDRDAVMVVTEAATDAIVQQIANSVIATVTASAYRHHPSGIHRWFVAPIEPTGPARPAGGVIQVDRSVVDDLPSLGVPRGVPQATPTAIPGDLSIEWTEPDPSGLGLPAPVEGAAPAVTTSVLNIDIQAELDRFDADRADWTAAFAGAAPDAAEPSPSPLGDFRIVWPDGTRDESILANAPVVTESDSGTPPATTTSFADATDTPIPATTAGEPPLPSPAPTARAATERVDTAPGDTAPGDTVPVLAGLVDTAPVVTSRVEAESVARIPTGIASPSLASPVSPTGEHDGSAPDGFPAPLRTPTIDGSLQSADAPVTSTVSSEPGLVGFTLEPLKIDRIPKPDAAVPDDVAAAVRRALQAIENSSRKPSSVSVPEMKLSPVELPKLSMPLFTQTIAEPAVEPSAPQPAPIPAQAEPSQAEPSQAFPSQAVPTASPPSPPTLPQPAPPAPPPAPNALQPGAAAAGFAPPTMEMRAEAVYERADTEAQPDPAVSTEMVVDDTAPSYPEPGRASVVFVEDDEDDQVERRGALRRLIGSLRGRD